jgi:phage terminase Nu1 subunit (DNA packaging protein)
MTLLTKGEFASHRGVGKSAVSNWAKKGLLVMGECPETGAIKVDVERTDARINARVDPMRGRPTGGLPLNAAVVEPAEEGGDPRLAVRSAALVRTELAEEQLVERRMKNARDAGDLAPRVELERRAAEMGRVARERMHAMWRAISERLAAERDVRAVMALGITEIDRVFAQLADDVERGALVADDATVEEAALEAEVAEQLAQE